MEEVRILSGFQRVNKHKPRQETRTDAYSFGPAFSYDYVTLSLSCLPARFMMHERGGAGTRPLRLTMVTGKKKVPLLPSCLLRPDLGMLNHA